MPPKSRNLIEKVGRIQLAISALNNSQITTIRKAARHFQVPESTLRTRLHSITPRAESAPTVINWVQIKKNHFYIGLSLWTNVEQLPDRPMSKIWPVSSSLGGDLPTTNPLARTGCSTSLNVMMSLMPVILGDITTSVRNVKIQRP